MALHIDAGTDCTTTGTRDTHCYNEAMDDPWFDEVSDIPPTGSGYTLDAFGIERADFGKVVAVHGTIATLGGDYAHVVRGSLAMTRRSVGTKRRYADLDR